MATNPNVKLNRETYIGGSDSAGVMGVSPWRSPYRVWCEKVGVEIPTDLDTLEFVYFGNVLEPIVASEFTKRTGIKVRTKRALLRYKQLPFIGGHIDFKVVGEKAFLECKTSNAFDYKLWGPSESGRTGVPLHYAYQCDHYMLVEDCTHCYIATLIGGNQFRWYRLERNPKTDALLIDAYCKFWNRVKDDDPPPITSESDAKHRWKETQLGVSVAVDKATRERIVEFAQVASKRKLYEAQEKALRDWLFPLFQDKESLSESGDVLVSLTAYFQNRIDADALRKKHPAIAVEVTKKIPIKRLNIHI